MTFLETYFKLCENILLAISHEPLAPKFFVEYALNKIAAEKKTISEREFASINPDEMSMTHQLGAR